MTTKQPMRRRVLRIIDVKAKTGLKHDSIYRGARDGWFPKPIKLSTRASGWFEDEIDAYLQRCAAARDGRTGPANPSTGG